jgi:transposase-like protein
MAGLFRPRTSGKTRTRKVLRRSKAMDAGCSKRVLAIPLHKDKEVLFTFYDFPAQHWPHLRTTNPIESTFVTVRLRTHRTKGCGSRIATLTMVFKLGLEAQKHWRRLQGFELIPKVVTGVRFVDGEEQTQQAA